MQCKRLNEFLRTRRNPRVLELFSGIGGFKRAVEEIWKPLDFVGVDINDQAMSEYLANENESVIGVNLSVNTMEVGWFDEVAADIWCMSPPCQPYSVQGHYKDVNDKRSDSIKNLTKVFSQLRYLPRFVLLENVPPFANSQSWANFRDCIISRGFSVTTYDLSSTTFGYPNNRRRFYAVFSRYAVPTGHFGDADFTALGSDIISFVEKQENNNMSLWIPEALMAKPYAHCLDVSTPTSTCTTCFTKGYGRFLNGTGSVWQFGPSFAYGNVRFFSPREISRMMGFDVHPLTKSGLRASWKLLGNSLNPQVVRIVIKHHLCLINNNIKEVVIGSQDGTSALVDVRDTKFFKVA